MERTLTSSDYTRLLTFRTRLRQFLRWSQEQAESLGLTTAQHQLLLAVRGHTGSRGPTITDAAKYLLVRHQTAVGLVDRTSALGLIVRQSDDSDQRVVRLALTQEGADLLRALSARHIEELERLAPLLGPLLTDAPGQTGDPVRSEASAVGAGAEPVVGRRGSGQ